jgi:TIR domain
MAYKVFISFSSRDKAIANSLTRQLTKAGAEVSTAESSQLGSDIKLHIADAIQQSDEVITIVTKHSAQNQWLSFEAGLAAGLGKKLLPVIAGIAPSKLPPVLKSFQAIVVDKFPQYVAKLSGKIRA